MSNLPISSKYRSTPHLPVTDEERNTIVTRLNEAYTDGRVDSDTYHGLLDVAFGARRLGDLAVVVEALPPVATYPEPGLVAQTGNPGELTPAQPPRPAMVATVVAVGLVALVVVVLMLTLVL